LGMLCLEKFPVLPKLTSLDISYNNLVSLDVRQLKAKFPILKTYETNGNRISDDDDTTLERHQCPHGLVTEEEIYTSNTLSIPQSLLKPTVNNDPASLMSVPFWISMLLSFVVITSLLAIEILPFVYNVCYAN
jgi:hypothetical protein